MKTSRRQRRKPTMWSTDLREALACPTCSQLLRAPVTLSCGHTVSRSCLCLSRATQQTSDVEPTTITSTTTPSPPSFYRCPVCAQTFDAGTVTCLKTNVLVQGLVNKVAAGRDSPASAGGGGAAGAKDASRPNDAAKKSQQFAENASDAKLRRRLSREYRRKGIIHLEESIAAFCLATFCESRNQSIAHVVGKVLHHLLSSKRLLRTRCHSAGPCLHVPTEPCAAMPVSDCEDSSSGDEELLHGVIGLTELRKIVERIVREVDRVKNTRTPPVQHRPVTPTDLECVLCSRCLLDPVTTTCGHTFCRGCLERALDYGTSCPLCVAPITRSDLTRRATSIVERVSRIIAASEYDDRVRCQTEEIEAFENDSQVPVFVCTTSFPGVACPLFVYEPRYRLMTRRCLRSKSRRFAMAAPSARSDERFAKYGTMLEIRDVVSLQDGRSILSTVAMKRFKVVEKGEKDGYDTASIRYIEDNAVAPEHFETLIALHDRVRRKAVHWLSSWNLSTSTEVERTLGAMPPVEPDWLTSPDGPAWSWWLMPILPLNTQLQVDILGTTSLEKRLRAIDKTLDRVRAHMCAVGQDLRQSDGTEKPSRACVVAGASSGRHPMEL